MDFKLDSCLGTSVFGVDEVKSVSVMVGDSLTLNTDFTETKGDELHWKIEGESDVIAQIDREANKITVPGNNEERFRDRLKLDHQTGSLTITNIRTTDSGVYELKIKDSMNDNKCRFIVTVRDVFFVDTDGVKFTFRCCFRNIWCQCCSDGLGCNCCFTARRISNQGKGVSVKIK
ncbi:unnamed protein product [Leuciscus chuanchicus]